MVGFQIPTVFRWHLVIELDRNRQLGNQTVFNRLNTELLSHSDPHFIIELNLILRSRAGHVVVDAGTFLD